MVTYYHALKVMLAQNSVAVLVDTSEAGPSTEPDSSLLSLLVSATASALHPFTISSNR